MPRIIILAYLVDRDSNSRKRLKVNLQSARKPASVKKVDSSRTTFYLNTKRLEYFIMNPLLQKST